MSRNEDFFTIQFLELVKCSQEKKAKDLIENVREEIKIVNKIPNLVEDHKNTITILENMIQAIQAGKFKIAKQDHVKARNGFRRIIKDRLQTRKTDISEVEKLPDDVVKQKKRPKSGKIARKSTDAKGNTHEAESRDPTVGSMRTKGSNPVPRPRSSYQNIDKKGSPTRTSPGRKENKVRSENALSIKCDVPNLERSMYDQKSERAIDKQNQKSTQERPSEKYIFDLQMGANNPRIVKELFKQLHENEWTDAFIVLEDISKQADAEITKTLLDIVHMAYKFCHEEAELQLHSIVENMCCIVASGQQKPCKEKFKRFGDVDLIKQYRLEYLASHQADCALNNLFSKFKTNYINTNVRLIPQKALHHDDFEKYLEKCVQVTWLMTLQDPPTTVLSTDRFEPSMYHPPLRNDHVLDYIEWPALMYGNNLFALGEAKYKRRQ